MALLFSERQLSTLVAFCDTLIPALDCPPDTHGLYARKASDLHVAQAIDAALPAVTDEASQAQLKLFLDVLEQPLINGLLDHVAKPFATMTLQERTTLLQGWAESTLPVRRQAFQALKRLAFFMFYALLDEQGLNPNWSATGYSGPPPTPTPTEKPIRPLALNSDSVLYTDVVIVGSGAGGGVVAGELSAAGLDVIVLEKGGYYTESDFDGRELSSNQRLFDNKGLLASADLGIMILAGSTLGGGTVINWNASFRTPEHVLDEWERDFHVDGFRGAAYQASLDAVSARLNVNEQECKLNPQNAVLERGSTALGYAVKTIPRNVKGCEECGFCTFGCQFGAKQSTLKTYLQDAHDRGARMVVNVEVERVLIEYGQAVGVVGTAMTADGRSVQLTVRARVVVAAAGSLHTPALLLRSGLSNPNIGRNLHLHPATVTFGIYDEPIRGWQGVPMSRYVPQFSDLDGTGYGFILETAPVHLGISALTLSWSDGAQHKRTMEQMSHLSNILIIIRDREGGRVTVNRYGKPVVHYTLSSYDQAHLAKGIAQSLSVHEAAGANEISSPHSSPHMLRFGNQLGSQYGSQRRAELELFLAKIQALGWRKNSFALFSAHQMSSCRMGGSPARGALSPTGESFEVRNLFVADGSILPTAVGRNPMITIMGVSHQIAQHIKIRLNRN